MRKTLLVLVLIAAGCAGIREPWLRQGTVMADPTCSPVYIEETGSVGDGMSAATFMWNAECDDGRTLRCSGTPNEQGGGMRQSSCR